MFINQGPKLFRWTCSVTSPMLRLGVPHRLHQPGQPAAGPVSVDASVLRGFAPFSAQPSEYRFCCPSQAARYLRRHSAAELVVQGLPVQGLRLQRRGIFSRRIGHCLASGITVRSHLQRRDAWVTVATFRFRPIHGASMWRLNRRISSRLVLYFCSRT